MTKHALLAAGWCASAVAFAACTGPSPTTNSASAAEPDPTPTAVASKPAPSPSPTERETTMHDVVNAAFPVPGPDVASGDRLLRAVDQLKRQVCSSKSQVGRGYPADGWHDVRTAVDVELISRFGIQQSLKNEEPIVAADCGTGRPKNLERWLAVNQLWKATAIGEARASEAVVATQKQTATCLAERGGAELNPESAIFQFLQNAGDVTFSPELPQNTSKNAHMGTVFADCTRDYYARMREFLQPKRDEYVERYAKVLEGFAADMDSAGYVPFPKY